MISSISLHHQGPEFPKRFQSLHFHYVVQIAQACFSYLRNCFEKYWVSFSHLRGRVRPFSRMFRTDSAVPQVTLKKMAEFLLKTGCSDRSVNELVARSCSVKLKAIYPSAAEIRGLLRPHFAISSELKSEFDRLPWGESTDLKEQIQSVSDRLANLYQKLLDEYIRRSKYCYWSHAKSEYVEQLQTPMLGVGGGYYCLHLLVRLFLVTAIQKLNYKQIFLLIHIADQLKEGFVQEQTLIDKSEKVFLKYVTKQVKNLDDLPYFFQQVGLLFTSGFHGLGREPGHLTSLGLQKTGETYTILDCNAGEGHIGSSYFGSKTAKTTTRFRRCSREVVINFLAKSFVVLFQPPLRSHKLFSHAADRKSRFFKIRQDLLKQATEANRDLPERPLQSVANCSFQSIMEWVYVICWTQNEPALGNLLESFCKTKDSEARAKLISKYIGVISRQTTQDRDRKSYKTLQDYSRLTRG